VNVKQIFALVLLALSFKPTSAKKHYGDHSSLSLKADFLLIKESKWWPLQQKNLPNLFKFFTQICYKYIKNLQ